MRAMFLQEYDPEDLTEHLIDAIDVATRVQHGWWHHHEERFGPVSMNPFGWDKGKAWYFWYSLDGEVVFLPAIRGEPDEARERAETMRIRHIMRDWEKIRAPSEYAIARWQARVDGRDRIGPRHTMGSRGGRGGW